MAIPNDPLERHWMQADLYGDESSRSFDEVLVSLVAWGLDRSVHLVGTGFIIAGFGRQALAVSAAHNFDHAARVQRPWQISHPSALPEFTIGKTRCLSIDRRSLRALYRNKETVDACIIGEVNLVPELDIAIFSIQLQDYVPGTPLTGRLTIDTSIPASDREVVALAYGSMAIKAEEVGNGLERFVMQRRVALRRGIITAVHSHGGRVTWPCFETSIPVDSGMSGGPVLWYGPEYEPGARMVACGMVSKDFSSDDARSSYMVPGCSTMAMLWPALGLAVHGAYKEGGEPERVFLLDLVKREIVQEVGGAATHAALALRADGKVTVTRSRMSEV